MADETVKVQIIGDASGAVDAAGKAAGAVQDSVQQMKSDLGALGESGNQSMGNLGAAFEELSNKFKTGLQITGIGAAIAGLDALKNVFEKFGDDAIQIENMSAILGLSVEQFQGLKQAAEETNAPIENVARASERLRQAFVEAQAGSAGAIVKLKDLGFTTAEINDKTRDFNQVLLELSARLKDPATAQDTLNGLITIFGTRAVLAAEAIKKYSGEAKGVNALNQEQVSRLSEVAIWWKEVGTAIGNTTAKLLVYSANAFKAMRVGDDFAAQLEKFGHGAPGSSKEGNDPLPAAAVAIQASHEVTQAMLADLKQQIDETRAGTEQRLALIKQFYQESLQYYGTATTAPVRAAHVEMINSERELSDKRKAFLEEWAGYYQTTTLRNEAAVHEMNAKLDKELQEQDKKLNQFFDDWAKYYQQLTLKNAASEAAADAKFYKAQNEMATKLRQEWKSTVDGISNAFTGVMDNMLNRGQTFGQSMKSLFASMGESIIGTLVKVRVEQAVNAAISKATGVAAAKSNVMANAAQAASGAMASAAEIPYVGWILAPLAGAAVYAAALAFPTAEGGFDVPQGVNPITQLHGEEMVLPRKYANMFRDMESSGGGRGGGGGDNHFHMSASSLDPGGMASLFKSPAGRKALADGIRSAYRRGTKGARR